MTPDLRAKLPGRGAWVTNARAALETAMKKRAFARAFECAAAAPDDLADAVDAGLEAAALSALGLARRAGDIVLGFEKTIAATARETTIAFIVASDAGADGREKIARAARGPVVSLFSIDALSQALGEGNAVYGAVKAGGPGERFLIAARRLAAFREGPPGG